MDQYLQAAWRGDLLTALQLKLVCLKLKERLINEANVVSLAAPLTVVGDLHG
jgi:serine/threonine-protein phosphatase PPG1